MKHLFKISTVFLTVWFVALIGVVVEVLYIAEVRKETLITTPPFLRGSLIGLVVLGLLGLATALIGFILYEKLVLKKRNIVLISLKTIATFAILPIYQLWVIFKPGLFLHVISTLGLSQSWLKRSPIRIWWVKLSALLVTLLLMFPIWIGIYLISTVVVLGSLGYIGDEINIRGTGSMTPTFPRGQGEQAEELYQQIVLKRAMLPYPNGLKVFGKQYFTHRISRGDIVLVKNDKTSKIDQERYGQSSGWIKRVIALGGDTLEIRDGLVYLNSQPLDEPYLARARSTFGQGFLKECTKVRVPENSVFVMGDNRMGSGDSREVGFFSTNDISYVLPFRDQKGDLAQNWRDTSQDLSELSKFKIDKEQYLQLLNEKRQARGLPPLKYQPKLETSALKRGEVVLRFEDYSVDAPRTGYTLKKALGEVGYFNGPRDEVQTHGYYQAKELIEYQSLFPDFFTFLLSEKYQEIGIAEVDGEMNGCPTHFIIQHFVGS